MKSEKQVTASDFVEGFLPRDLWPETPPHERIPGYLFPKKNGDFFEYGWWPFRFLVALSDTEPTEFPRYIFPRIAVWDRVRKVSCPPSWISIGKGRSEHGVLSLLTSDVKLTFNETARRELACFAKYKGGYDFVETDIEAFQKEYEKSDTYACISPGVVKKMMISAKKRSTSKLHTVCLFAVEKKSGNVHAGILYESSLLCQNTYYSIGFLANKKEKRPLMVGLVHLWLTSSQKEGMVCANFGLMYRDGDPKEWKGFTTFKEKFGVTRVTLPPSLIKIVWR